MMSIDAVLLLGLSLVPLLPLARISTSQVTRARDGWLLGLLAIATVWLATHARVFLPLALWFLCRWPRAVAPWTIAPSAVTWAAIAATWLLVRSVPRGTLEWLPAGWYVVAILEVGLMARQVLVERRRREVICGTFGQRQLAAGYLALVIPFAWAWHPVLALPVLPGLLWTRSGMAWLALGCAIAWHGIPLQRVGQNIAALAVVGALAWGLALRSRLASGNTWRNRLTVLRLVARETPWPWGAGPNAMGHALRVWQARFRVRIPIGDAHNEAAQLVYEYGVAGVATVLLLVWEVAPRLRLGDPWSAAVIAGAVLSCGTIPCRVASVGVVWLVVMAGLR